MSEHTPQTDGFGAGGSMAQSLPAVALGLGAIYVLLCPAHLVVIPRPAGPLLSALSGLAAAATLALGLSWRRRPPRPETAPRTFAALCLLVLVLSTTHMALVTDPRHTTNFAALLVGIGLFQLDRRWLVASVAVVWATWAGLVAIAPALPGWGHYAFVLVLATGLSGAIHAARVALLRSLARAAARLARSEERFRSLATSAPDPILAIDAHSTIHFANPAVEIVLGWPPEELIGDGLTRLIPAELRAAHANGLARYLERGERHIPWQNVRLEALHRAGHRVPVEVSFNEWTDDGEKRFIGYIRDVTLREESERERLELERRVQDMQRLESLGLLAGGIAHDFNNLLAPVVGHASLLAEAGEGGDAPAAREILDAAERAAQLTQQLLAYAGRAPDRRVDIDVSSFVADLARLIGPSLPAEGRLDLDLAHGLPRIACDPGQLHQVVLNLIRNADDATAPGDAIRIVTGCRHLDAREASELLPRHARPSGDFVVFEVRDAGPGMPEDVQARIFDPFFTTKGSHRGLGLAAALGIARANGGGLEVESTPGRGTTMRLLLPASGPPIQSPAPVAAPSAIEAEEPTGKGRVLVVDDEPALRRMARRMLERLGYDVKEAENGEDALERLDEIGELTLVVLDLSMPGMGGPETLVRLRERRPHLPVLLCSGYDASDDRATGHGLPGVGFLQKPYEIADLGEAMRALIEAPFEGDGA